MAKEKSKPKKVSEPKTALELGPSAFTSQKDYEEQVELEAKAK